MKQIINKIANDDINIKNMIPPTAAGTIAVVNILSLEMIIELLGIFVYTIIKKIIIII